MSKECSLIPVASEVKSEQSFSQESFGYHPAAPCRASFVFCFSLSTEGISFPDDNNVAFLSHRIENLFLFFDRVKNVQEARGCFCFSL